MTVPDIMIGVAAVGKAWRSNRRLRRMSMRQPESEMLLSQAMREAETQNVRIPSNLASSRLSSCSRPSCRSTPSVPQWDYQKRSRSCHCSRR